MHTTELLISDPPEDDLRRLATAAQGGDTGALSDLVRRVATQIRTWAVRFAPDADEADDVAQQVLIRMRRQIGSYEGRSRFTSWLYRLTWNVAADGRVRRQRRRELLARHAATELQGTTAGESVEHRLEAESLANLVRQYRGRLTARERQVFDLIDLRDRTAAEAATQLGITPSTVRVLLARARRTIRLAMLEEHPDLLEEYPQ